MRPDLTVVLNAHREGRLLDFTLRSLTDAALHASSLGIATDLVVVLDDPDDATRAALGSSAVAGFVGVEAIEVGLRSLGLARNAGLALARGTFVATADGDDLYSFNYLASALSTARGGDCVLAVPEIAAWFDGDACVERFESLAAIGPLRLLGAHPFVSCMTGRTEFLRELGYRDCARHPAFAFEDYDLTCRAVAAGADIRAAEDAVLFYRRRPGSVMAEIGHSPRIAPQSPFFDRAAVAAIAEAPDVVADGGRMRRGLLDLRASRRLAVLAAHASEIDRRVDPAGLAKARVWSSAMFDRDFGAAYRSACRLVGTTSFDAILVAPDPGAVPRGPMEDGRSWLVLQSEPDATPLSGAVGLAVSAERRAELAARIALAVAPEADLHATEAAADLAEFMSDALGRVVTIHGRDGGRRTRLPGGRAFDDPARAVAPSASRRAAAPPRPAESEADRTAIVAKAARDLEIAKKKDAARAGRRRPWRAIAAPWRGEGR